MTKRVPVIVQSEHLAEAAVAWLRERSQLVQISHDSPEFSSTLSRADGLIVRTYTIVDEQLLERSPALRVVGRAGVGLDNIDIAACRNRGIEVVYTPDANTRAVVEYVIALICDAMRPRDTIHAAIDQTSWNRLRAEIVATRELRDLTLGILGLGRIGRQLARVARPLVRTVVYHDLVDIPPDQRHGAEAVGADDLFTMADVLSVHVDGRASNRQFIDEQLLSRMKSNAVLINTSRGFVVDNAALASFLQGHPDARAMLDVHDPEPIPPSNPLLGLSNASLYPHLASRTRGALERMSWVARDVVAVLAGRPPEFPAPD